MFGCSFLCLYQDIIQIVHSRQPMSPMSNVWAINFEVQMMMKQKTLWNFYFSLYIYIYWNPRHPWKIPRTRKTKVWKRIFLLKGLFFRLHVDFQGWGCNGLHFPKTFSRSQPFRDVSVALEKWKRFVSCHKFLGVYNSPVKRMGGTLGAWPSGCS